MVLSTARSLRTVSINNVRKVLKAIPACPSIGSSFCSLAPVPIPPYRQSQITSHSYLESPLLSAPQP